MLLCPNCHQPVREQAKFCNRCGAPLQTGGAPVAAEPEAPALQSGSTPPPEMGQPDTMPAAFAPQSGAAPPPGKATPTGPMNLQPASTADGATQPSPATAAEALEPPPQPAPAAPDAVATEMAASLNHGEDASGKADDFYAKTQQPPVPATPSEELYGIDPYAPLGTYSAMEAPDSSAEEAELDSADEEAPTVLVPRPGRNEVPVTSELLASLGEHTPLEPGMVLEDRYRVEEVIHTSEEENLYRVIDLRGYLHCWACGTDFPDNPETERFCSNCGADMLGRDYWLRERMYIEEESQAHAADEEAGLVAQEAGPPSVNGAHPEEAAAMAASGADSGEYLDAESEELDWPTQPMTAVTSFVVIPRHYRVEAIETEDPIFPVGVTLVAGARSDVGQTRRGNPNEDSMLVMNLSRIHESISQPFGLFIVADGLGGHDDGQTASRRAIGEIAKYITHEVLLPALPGGQFATGEALAATLKAAVEAANLVLVGSNEQTGSDMGSTVTGAMVVGDTAYVVNVGDSRTYLFDGISLQPISVDHSLVMQLVAGGLINRDDIYTHPQRNQILRSLGDRRDVQVDLFTQKLKPGYQLVICCDGLWEMIRDPQIEQILRENSDPQAAADLLMRTANENGGEDNISVIVVQARE